MKKITRILVIFLMSLTGGSSVFAVEIIENKSGSVLAELEDNKFETGFLASKPLDKWNFELVNRSNKEIRIIINADAYKDRVEHFTIAQKVIPAKVPLLPLQTPKLRAALPRGFNYKLIIQTQENSGTQQVAYMLAIKDNPKQNVFVTFENGSIHPQEGILNINPLIKAKKTTKSGLPLINNITASQIINLD
ncbi:hypothetical protein Noda2021_03100 [Candidatus Dependentiae bacterium Noda2021]|nr:hypothetical protein Noda2021_03100 [Candidatus Dependentiae bacterium Noda2021]